MIHTNTFRNCVRGAHAVRGNQLYVQPVAATTITFDDLSDNGLGTAIANGYQGLNWPTGLSLTHRHSRLWRPKRRSSRNYYSSEHRV